MLIKLTSRFQNEEIAVSHDDVLLVVKNVNDGYIITLKSRATGFLINEDSHKVADMVNEAYRYENGERMMNSEL